MLITKPRGVEDDDIEDDTMKTMMSIKASMEAMTVTIKNDGNRE